MPVILDMPLEAYLCSLEWRVLLLCVYTSVNSDIPWICLYARSYTAGVLFNSVL